MADAELLSKLRSEIRSIETGSSSASGLYASLKTGEEDNQTYKSSESVTKKSSASDAMSKIINLVNVSDRSEHAIRERLERDGFAVDEIDEAVERAKGYGFIDDARYAEVLVRSRISQGKGALGIERELREHDIDIDVVPGWPCEYPVDYDQEIDRAMDLLRRKPPKSKNQREGAYRKLVGKGYSPSVASTAARKWAEGGI